jgi:hypothetical protein
MKPIDEPPPYNFGGESQNGSPETANGLLYPPTNVRSIATQGPQITQRNVNNNLWKRQISFIILLLTCALIGLFSWIINERKDIVGDCAPAPYSGDPQSSIPTYPEAVLVGWAIESILVTLFFFAVTLCLVWNMADFSLDSLLQLDSTIVFFIVVPVILFLIFGIGMANGITDLYNASILKCLGRSDWFRLVMGYTLAPYMVIAVVLTFGFVLLLFRFFKPF